MKQGNLDKWTNLEECTNLLLFSELVNELLFDYSIPSHRKARADALTIPLLKVILLTLGVMLQGKVKM